MVVDPISLTAMAVGLVIKKKALLGASKVILTQGVATGAANFIAGHAAIAATITAGLVLGVIAHQIAKKLADLVAAKKMEEKKARDIMTKVEKMDEKDQLETQKLVDELHRKVMEM